VAGRENTSRFILGCSLRLSLSHLFLGVPANSIVGGMRFLSDHQLAVAACRYRCCIALFWALLAQVTALTPHTTRRLFAVSPDMAELLTVVTLHETVLSFVYVYPDYNMAKAHQSDYLM
jgi:hypothetical protein